MDRWFSLGQGMSDIVLHHFLFSHFNEKARWALAYKNLPHQRVGVIPGVHAKRMRQLSGQTKTPVLVVDGKIVCGSAALINELETRFPEPALYPADAAARAQALAWQERVDTQLGPDTRSIVWGVLIENPGYTARMFGRDLNPVLQYGYGHMLKRGRRLIVKLNRVSPDNLARARIAVEKMLDEIAAGVSATGYLAGSAFSVADLAAASLLSPLLRLEYADMRRPEPMPPALTALIDEYAPHPAMIWAAEMFRQHRPPTV